MERSLQLSLVKRALKLIHSTGKAYLYYLAQEEIVLATEGGGGSHIHEEKCICEISISAIYQEIACVTADNLVWIEYLHLAKLDGQRLFVNVLYTANRNES